MKWAGKPKRVKTTFNGRTERGKYIKPFCPERRNAKEMTPTAGLEPGGPPFGRSFYSEGSATVHGNESSTLALMSPEVQL